MEIVVEEDSLHQTDWQQTFTEPKYVFLSTPWEQCLYSLILRGIYHSQTDWELILTHQNSYKLFFVNRLINKLTNLEESASFLKCYS